MMFRSINQSPALSFGVDANGLHRIGGTGLKLNLWQKMNVCGFLCCGIFACTTTLALGWWTGFVSIQTGHTPTRSGRQTCILLAWFHRWTRKSAPRTRLLLPMKEDWKTLSVSVAVRWITHENMPNNLSYTAVNWTLGISPTSRFLMILTALMSCQVLDSLILNFTKTSLLSRNFLGFTICKIDKLCQTHLCSHRWSSSRSHRNGLQ